MKKFFLLVYSTFFFFNSAFSQNPLVKQWDKRFGGGNIDYLHSLHQTTDGGYILGGASNSDSSGDKTQPSWGGIDYWIIKTDSLGNKQWDKDFGGSNDDVLYPMQQTTDGGYILGGASNSDSSGNKTQHSWGFNDYWIVKTDSLGSKEWDKRFGGTNIDFLSSLQQTTDGGYILGGHSFSDSSGDKTQPSWGYDDYWIVKTDSLGNKQWDKRFGGTGSEYFTSLQQTTDGGYILGGFSTSDSTGDKTQHSWGYGDYWIVKTDSLGNKQWDKRFGGTNAEWLFSLQQTIDGGYILGGYSNSGISGDKTESSWGGNDYWLVKTDSLGDKQWDKDLGGTSDEELLYISQISGGGYLVGGESESPLSGDKTENNLGTAQTWVLLIDSLGNKQWDKTIFTTGNDVNGYIQTKDGCYLIANSTWGGIGGYKTQPSWNSSYDYWIIKFCDSTLTTSIPISNQQSTNFNVFPNPAQDEFTVSGLAFPVLIKMFDVFGREVFSQTITASNFKLQTSDFSNGIYIIKAHTGKEVFQKKLIINH